MHYSVAQLVGTGTPADPFRPPTAEEFSIIDLRPLSAQEEGKVDGWVLVATPERDRKLGIYLGNSSTEVSPVVATLLSARLGLNLDADPNLGEIVGELLTRHATGAKDKTSWNPLQPTKIVRRDGNLYKYEAYLGNEVVWSREVLRADGGQQYTDNFNRSNSSSPGSPWQVRVGAMPIVSQKLQPSSSTEDLAVYYLPLNTDNHWAQIDQVTSDANFRGIDAQVRHQSGSTDESCYGTGYIVKGGSYEMYKKATNGNQTNLYTVSRTNPQSATIRTDINGSTLTGTVSGTVQNSVTDTSIPTGKYAAIFTYQAASVVSLDNFITSDFQATFEAAGTINSSGIELSRTRKAPFTATVPSAGVVTKIRSVFKLLTGTIAPGPGLVRRGFLRVFAGGIFPTAPTVRKIPRIGTNLAGEVDSTARIKFSPIRKFAGTVASSGALTLRNFGRIFGEAGIVKVFIEVAGEVRSWISKD